MKNKLVKVLALALALCCMLPGCASQPAEPAAPAAPAASAAPAAPRCPCCFCRACSPR